MNRYVMASPSPGAVGRGEGSASSARSWAFVALAVVAELFGNVAERPVFSQPLVIHDVQVVDVDRGTVRSGQDVSIELGRIVAVEESRERPASAGEVIDGRGLFLIPGLWNLHAHLDGHTEVDLAMMVSQGVLGLRDLGSDPLRARDLQRRVEAGELLGPTIRFAGPILEDRAWLALRRAEQPLEHRVPVDSAEEARTSVAIAAALGADVVKVRNSTDASTFRAMAEAAAAHGLHVAAHEPMVVPLDQASRLGLRTLEHLPFVSLTMPGAVVSEAEVDRTLDALADSGVFLVPTLVASRNLGRSPVEKLAQIERPDHRYAYVATSLRDSWRRMAEDDAGPLPWQEMLEQSYALTRRMMDRGVRLLAGTDMGVPLTFPGFALHEELSLMAEKLGLTPAEALRTATTNPALLFGQVGGVTSGAPASLVLLRSNPLEAIENTREIEAVIHGGRHLDRSALDRLLEDAKRRRDQVTTRDFLGLARAECESRPSPACRFEVGLALYSQGDFDESARWLSAARHSNDPTVRDMAVEAWFSAEIQRLHGADGASRCDSSAEAANRWMERLESRPVRRLGALGRLVSASTAAGCDSRRRWALSRTASIDSGNLDPESRVLRAELSSLRLFDEGREDEAIRLRESVLDSEWKSDAQTLRQAATWYRRQRVGLDRGRELARLAAQATQVPFERLQAMLIEAEIAAEQQDYAAAVGLLEQITSQVQNERLEAALERYRGLAAETETMN